jgi:hypothetical protein
MSWIFGDFKKDALFLYLPGALGVLVACLSPQLGESSLFYGLLVTAFLDSGHVYTTMWRTHLHPEERKSSVIYWVAPPVIFLFFATWYGMNWPYLWSFVVYASFYHHLRQVYGFSKWYQFLNGAQRKVSDYFLYGLSCSALLAYHFRSGVMNNYYGENDLLIFPNERNLTIATSLYTAIFVAWVVYEFGLWRRGAREYNRILAIIVPVLVYSYCFFVGKTITEVLFPFTILHAVSYFAIMSQTLTRTQKKRFKSFTTAFGIICLTAFIFGGLESAAEEHIVGVRFNQTIVVGLYLTPLFLHYFYDAVIWKKKHREAPVFLKVSE